MDQRRYEFKVERHKRGFSQERLGKLARVHSSKISRFERGWMRLSDKEMDRLATALAATAPLGEESDER